MTELLHKPRHDRLIYLPVILAVAIMWFALAWLAVSEREFTLQGISDELHSTIMTIADLNELSQQLSGETGIRTSQRQSDEMWRALLRHPTSTIWVESDGDAAGGSPPAAGSFDDLIVVEEVRDDFTIRAAMPRDDALIEWRRRLIWRIALMALATVSFLFLTHMLLRTLRQRAAAERETVTARDRAAQLARYKNELEATVAERTEALKQSNALLEKELTDRKAAESELQQHDALLHAVTKSAAELLGSHSHDEAVSSVLALIGQTVGVGRVQINRIQTVSDGHLHAEIASEWSAPGMDPLIDRPDFKTVDLTRELPRVAAALVGGSLVTFEAHEAGAARRQLLEQTGIRSVLQIPIAAEDKLWGSLDFIDGAETARKWNWAETDTLETLANLIGAAITRASYVKELADANMIVQNSPTVLYRVHGQPPFSLIYVSHNITKYGHDPATLVGKPEWPARLMDSEDESRLMDAMARTVSKNTTGGATIEFRLRAGDGSNRWVENRYTPVRDKLGRLVEIEGMIIDITERKLAEEKIAHLARTDALTGLANRATFIERLRQAFHAAQRGASPFAILYLDLDHFKPINDTLGHPIGDKLLRKVADRLRDSTRANDLVARLGGDEFAILQSDVTEPAQAGTLAATIQSAVMRPFRIDRNELHVTASIGICPYDETSANPDTMLSQADLALYRSKEEGRNRYRFHSDDLDDQVLERVTLSDDLKRAIERNELELKYQPQVELRSNRIVGMEAFVRWHHPRRGLLTASAFVPVAEKTGSIIPLGQWVLEKACSQMRVWKDEGVNPPVITINLSLPQLKNSAELIKDVKTAIKKWKLEPADLNFDVTEAMIAQVTLMRNDVLSELRRIGVGISIDDFGSEYSSLDYLRTYRVNHLKITSDFMGGIAQDAEHARTVRAIINFARELNIGVISEGVETEEQVDISNATSVIAQGLYFSDAVDAEHAEALLRQGTIDTPDIEGGREPRARRQR